MSRPRLIYIGNIRLPTEKAHGLQIVQNCEAFADAGADVSLWAAARQNTPERRGVADIWAHYGVQHNFRLRRLPTIDLLGLVSGQDTTLSRLIFRLQAVTFALSMLIGALLTPARVYYSRDALVISLLSLIKPASQIGYEAHSKARGRAGVRLQARAVRHASVFATTARLRDDLIALGADPARVRALEDLGVRVLPVADVGRVPSIRNALALLAGEGVTRLLVEGGEIVWRAFAAEWLVDEVALFLAGGEGKGSPAAAVLAGEYGPGLHLNPTGQRRVGGDTLSMFRVVDLPRPDVGRSA